MSWLTVVDDGVELQILAVPRASRSRIVGVHDDRLKVQLAAPPADGAANDALVALFMELLGLKRSAVTLVSGHGSRQKRLRLVGVSPEAVARQVP